jgi:hypothetical protein
MLPHWCILHLHLFSPTIQSHCHVFVHSSVPFISQNNTWIQREKTEIQLVENTRTEFFFGLGFNFCYGPQDFFNMIHTFM